MSATTVQLYNTITRKLEPFEPRVPGKVGVYVCGPTPYARAHAVHARANLSFDVLVRHLRARGFDVNYVRNYTDVYPHILKEITHFFSIYKDLEGKNVEVHGWRDLDFALETIRRAQKAFDDKKASAR